MQKIEKKSSNQKNIKSGVSALSSTSTSFGTAAASTRYDQQPNGIDESVKAQALAEEEAAMNQYKVNRSSSNEMMACEYVEIASQSFQFKNRISIYSKKKKQTKLTSPTSSGAAAVNNPFLSSPTNSGNIVDLFGASNQPVNTKASDDLLQLGNPFADMFGPAQGAPPPAPAGNNMWMGNGIDQCDLIAEIRQTNIVSFCRLQWSSRTTVKCFCVRQQFLLSIWCN